MTEQNSVAFNAPTSIASALEVWRQKAKDANLAKKMEAEEYVTPGGPDE